MYLLLIVQFEINITKKLTTNLEFTPRSLIADFSILADKILTFAKWGFHQETLTLQREVFPNDNEKSLTFKGKVFPIEIQTNSFRGKSFFSYHAVSLLIVLYEIFQRQ